MPALSTMSGDGLTLATAGILGTFRMTARDAYSNVIMPGLYPLTALIQVPPGGAYGVGVTTRDWAPTSALVSYIVTAAGTYAVSAFTWNRTLIAGAPTTMTAQPGERGPPTRIVGLTRR